MCQADTDCDEGWRCGLQEGRCHLIGQAQAFACTSDLDCEANWRCGTDNRCVDSRLDGLPTTPAIATYAIHRVNPELPVGVPERASVSELFNGWNGESWREQMESVALVSDGGLLHIIRTPDEFRLPDGGQHNAMISSAPLPDGTSPAIAT